MPYAAPIADDEFAPLLDALLTEEHGLSRSSRLAVAVSGGADSMALAVLAHRYAEARRKSLLALICDHGIRPESASEARLVASRLRGLGIQSRILSLSVPPGTAIEERARKARYAALAQAMREDSRAVLLVGHHLRDQAETVALRLESKSGPDGLAGMAAVRALDELSILRPLLTVHPDRIRATLSQMGIPWVEDPMNQDPAYTRVRIRQELIRNPERMQELADMAAHHALERRRKDESARQRLRQAGAQAHRGGWVRFDLAALGEDKVAVRALGMLVRQAGSQADYLRTEKLERLLKNGVGSYAGIVVTPTKKATFISRELAVMQAEVPLGPWASWDGRHRESGYALVRQGMTIGPVQDDIRQLRGLLPGVPAVAIRAMPCIRQDGLMVHVPAIGWKAAGYEHRLLPSQMEMVANGEDGLQADRALCQAASRA